MKNKFEERTVIVIDNGNYNSKYAEQTPFKAELYLVTDYPCYWVRSLETGKNYELYANQILEFLDIEEIRFYLKGGEYGDFR